MKVGNAITIFFDSLLQTVCHPAIRSHVEKDRPGIANQSIGPARDHTCPNYACEWIHPKPPESAGESQTDDHENGHSGIRDYMDYGGPHVVITVSLAMCVLVLLVFHFPVVMVSMAVVVLVAT